MKNISNTEIASEPILAQSDISDFNDDVDSELLGKLGGAISSSEKLESAPQDEFGNEIASEPTIAQSDTDDFNDDIDPELLGKLRAAVSSSEELEDASQDEFDEEFEDASDEFKENKSDLEPDSPQEVDDASSVSREGEEPEESFSLEKTPFGEASSARGFIERGHSMNGLVAKLSKPPRNSAGAEQESLHQPAVQDSHQGQAAQERGDISLGRAIGMMGAKGLLGLGAMLGAGGSVVNSAITEYSFNRTERDFGDVISDIRAQMSDFHASGLSMLESESMTPEARETLTKQFFANPENTLKLDALVKNLDRMEWLSRKLIGKGVDRGMDGDMLLRQAVDPINRIMKEHEKLLESMKVGDRSLLERMEGSINNLFSVLRDLLVRAMGAFQGSGARASGPQMG